MTKRILTITLSLSLSALSSLAADSAAGKASFDKSCKSCHGATGEANPAIAKMMKVDMKSLSSADVQSQSDAALKGIITEGKGKMKPIKSVEGADVDNVVAYLHTLKK